MILVTGATEPAPLGWLQKGPTNVGQYLIPQLLDEGQDVRVLGVDPDRASLPPGVELFAGKFEEVDTLAPAMQGVAWVFQVANGPKAATYDANVATVAAAAGVGRLVKSSIVGIDDGDHDPVTEWHRAGEEAIDRVGIPRTFLRCGELMSIALWWAETIKNERKVYVPFADSPSAVVDPLDVAAVATRCLVNDRASDAEALTITGPEVLTSAERVQTLGELLGVELECVDVSREDAFERMTGVGQPPPLANARLEMMVIKAKGSGAVVHDTVEPVTGHPAHTFRDWATRHLDAFR